MVTCDAVYHVTRNHIKPLTSCLITVPEAIHQGGSFFCLAAQFETKMYWATFVSFPSPLARSMYNSGTRNALNNTSAICCFHQRRRVKSNSTRMNKTLIHQLHYLFIPMYIVRSRNSTQYGPILPFFLPSPFHHAVRFYRHHLMVRDPIWGYD